MKKEKLAIIGIFYDGYEDSWVDFVRCFNEYWPGCPFKKYIVDNEKRVDYPGFEVICAGKDAEYSKKVQTALNKIDADYYLLMLEDFYIGKTLQPGILDSVLDYIEKENIDYYCLASLSSFSKYKSDLYDKNIRYLYKVNPSRRYTLGCQAVIWKKEFLEICIGRSNYNAWVFEGALARSKRVHTSEFLSKCVKDQRNILRLKHGILQQKMIPPTVEYFKSIGNPLTTTREIMSTKAFNKYVFNSKLAAAIPKPVYRLMKKILGERRGNAVLDKYEEQINRIVKENFGY